MKLHFLKPFNETDAPINVQTLMHSPARVHTHTHTLADGPGDMDSIPGRVIPKTLKMVHDTYSLNTQHYKVRIKGKVEQSRERSSALPYTSV